MSKASNATASLVSSVGQVRRFLLGLNLSYTASVTVDSRYRHIVHATLGKPRPDTPCPLAVVHMKFTLKDDLRDILSYEIENERHVYRPRDNIAFDERLLDRVLARKIALKRSGLLDLGDDYTRSRVMEPHYDYKEPDSDAIDPEVLKMQLVQAFQTYDSNGDGSISYSEFRSALKSGPVRCDNVSHLVLTLCRREDQVQLLFTQADLDGSGRIDYEEFAKSAVDILARMPSGYQFKDEFHELYDDYLDYFHNECAMTMQILNQAFEAADYLPPNASGRTKAGKLGYDIFRKCLASPLANLSREEINLSLSLVPMDDDGKFDYANFDRVLAHVLFYIAQGQSLGLAVDIEGYLVSTFEAAEVAWTTESKLSGALPRAVVFDALHTLKKLMLSKGQIVLLIGYAKENAHGLVEYGPFAMTAAGMIRQFIHPRNVAKRMKLCKSDASAVASIFHGGNESSGIEQILLHAFEAEDRDLDGVLNADEFGLAMAHSSLALSAEEIASLRAVADTNGDGFVDYEEFSTFAVSHLVQLKRQRMLQMIAESKDGDDDDDNQDAK
ncbi:Aste57867_14370 [Aphanomyces stellatus]|uniref:Aste57867_14370 protein n=1 Tax=Aphanomyces stellatus TaxID=120398 RepID=A0A485L199_9STRA|nr:hypothetical protein As57867_014316 [Aphanomyces stellatus]VFT91193.1 Aste57867_14370 [Aphanomyces stellatus]